jgi:hypothetical protein
MPQASEHPPSHEDRKAQKLMERLDKKQKPQDKPIREDSGQGDKPKS